MGDSAIGDSIETLYITNLSETHLEQMSFEFDVSRRVPLARHVFVFRLHFAFS